MNSKFIFLIYILFAYNLFANPNSFRKSNNNISYLKNEIYNQLNTTNTVENSKLNKLLKIYYNKYTPNSNQYAECLMWCAMICEKVGDNKQASFLLNKSNQIFKKYGNGVFDGKDSINEIFFHEIKSRIEYNSNRYYYAIKHSKKSCELKKSFFGEHSEIYLMAILDLSRLYAEHLKLPEALKYHNQGYNAYVELIKNEFCNKCESDRSQYWNTAIKYINKTIDFAHKYADNITDSTTLGAVYNALLLSKGLLLNTTISFDNYVLESNNDEAIKLLLEKKSITNYNSELKLIDSLDYKILKTLRLNNQAFKLPQLSIKWQDVRNRLYNDELAIEFYQNSNGDYGAILIKKDWIKPKIIKLRNIIKINNQEFSLGQLLINHSIKNCTNDNIETYLSLSNAIWNEDILKYFPKDNNSRVFFSADGTLLTYNIENLPFKQNRVSKTDSILPISRYYRLHRLSSTRELVSSDNSWGNNNIAIFGGLKYDMNISNLTQDTNKFSNNIKNRALEQIEELPGTKIEVINIKETIERTNKRDLNIKLFIDTTGTESSFKSLSGSRQDIIHIATHGYFCNENNQIGYTTIFSDNPLNQTGLLLAGADNKWLGDSIPKNIEDGFLSAQEISTLDFRGLDLIVLSACETGQGKIMRDGVFGLQRGFKMASAKSILMSLWKVDDDATCLLMTEFYKNWISKGKTKHESLELAKKTVRSHKKWQDPEYWAAFILLDALD